jgi:hypothetical protein
VIPSTSSTWGLAWIISDFIPAVLSGVESPASELREHP